GSTTDFNLPGVRVSAAQLDALLGQLRHLAAEQDAVVLAGSLPPGMPADIYARAVAALRQNGVPLVAADTSGEALRHLLAAPTLPHLLKPNIHELEAALGRELPTDAARLEAARDLLERGAEWVALSLGEEGAWLVWAGGAVRALPPQVDVVSTVGAGDAMVAGLVSARLSGLTPSEALRRATAFAAGNITRLGANLPPHDELMALQRQVHLQKGC
ncbi:MAG: 1-phosphofructokinase family hexose kinase, partial [Deinococcus sp.]|nr:1-phosphofructokinase family hexose kinase [Deinococcus sp.]